MSSKRKILNIGKCECRSINTCCHHESTKKIKKKIEPSSSELPNQLLLTESDSEINDSGDDFVPDTLESNTLRLKISSEIADRF